MNTLLIGINSKFIHPNMAIRYLKANCDFPVTLKEYTIKDDKDFIINNILLESPEIVGFSCYIWNITLILEIVESLKTANPECIIILGGPEVSYEYDSYLKTQLADYIIINEGEISFNMLIKSLTEQRPLNEIPNLSYLKEGKIVRNTSSVILNLNSLNSPYYFDFDILDIPKKVQYVELSRGCPYQCSYCLASLEKGLRFFNIENVFTIIDYLVDKGAKTIKFLDRSFNANKKLALDFFKTLVDKDYKNTVFQFEINGDVLDQKIIDYLVENLKKDYVRFELGVQSTNDLVNQSINRFQNTNVLVNNIKSLQKSNVILHLDLIAGLPHEDLLSFKNTFNEIFSLFAEELQLGFLKMLKGTKIRKEAKLHDYVFSAEPPYEISKNKYISAYELEIIHQVEIFLEIYWNKGFMQQTIKHIMSNQSNPFDFFLNLSSFYKEKELSHTKYQLYDLFINLRSYLNYLNILDVETEDLLKLDYLLYNKVKPKVYWENDFKKQDIIRDFQQTNQEFNLDNLYKYSLVTKYKDGYLLVIYFPDKKEVIYWNNITKRISSL
ncbi:MAG: DUF4080 domain-containing protein [Candidatus Izemoplasmatales bacterium]